MVSEREKIREASSSPEPVGRVWMVSGRTPIRSGIGAGAFNWVESIRQPCAREAAWKKYHVEIVRQYANSRHDCRTTQSAFGQGIAVFCQGIAVLVNRRVSGTSPLRARDRVHNS